MIKKREMIYFFVFALIFLIGNAFAESTLSTGSVCCEKTKLGAFCQNGAENTCDNTAKIVPTSCESTSFCKLGTCYDSKEGLCLENVPQRVCQANGGTWSDKDANQLAQCKLGCCILADQASFVTMTRCKSLSTFFGIKKIDFRQAITSETACIAAANSQDEGACVSSETGAKTCKFTTRQQCGGTSTTSNLFNASPLDETTGKYFYKGLLCSAEELGIPNSARQASTACYEGKVYWFDSSGNRENVYSSNSAASWNRGRVATPDEICAKTGESKSCGNCDYLAGSRCASWDSSLLNGLGLTKPKNVNDYCKTTKCTDRDGKTRLNGESWCVYDGEVGNAVDPAGSRHYREICVDGTVQVEACEDFRNQVCIHSGIQTSQGEYSVAACRANRWQDCLAQTNKGDCENTDARDCMWATDVDGINLGNPKYAVSTGSSFTNPVSSVSSTSSTDTTSASLQTLSTATTAIGSFTGKAIQTIVGSGVGGWEENSLSNAWRINRSQVENGICVPLVSPGLDFWQSGSSTQVCGQASATCTVEVTKTYKKNIITGQKELDEVKTRENDCLTQTGTTFEVKPEWAAKANAVCSAMGDCGAGFNFNEKFVNEGYAWKFQNESYYFLESDLGLLSQKLNPGTGEVVKDYVINNKYQLKQGETVYVKA